MEPDDLKIVAKRGCSGKHCPTLYDTETDQYFVQGKVVDQALLQRLGVPSDETIVAIPKDLLDGHTH